MEGERDGGREVYNYVKVVCGRKMWVVMKGGIKWGGLGLGVVVVGGRGV